VVLVGLYELIVSGLASRGPVVAIELEVSLGVGGGVSANFSTGGFFNPNEFFNGVVEVEFEFGLSFLITGELKLFNEVFVGDLGKSATLIGVKVDVVNVESGRVEGASGTGDAVSGGGEFDVNFDLVVLEGNEGKRKAGVAAEPELKGNVESSGGTILTGVREDTGRIFDISTGNHGFVTVPVTFGLGEFIPNVEPVAVMFVNSLTTNFDFDRFNKFVANPRFVGITRGEFRESNLDVYSVDKITVSGDGAGYFFTVISGAVESLVNGFHREVGVSAVDYFEESNLGVT